MPASFALTLDTRAPQLTLGEAVMVGETLRLPYSVAEPEVTSAVADPVGGPAVSGQITSEFLLFDLEGRGWTYGVISVEVEDEVGNAATHEIVVDFLTSPVRYYERTAPIMPDPYVGLTPRYFTEVVEPYDEPVLPPMRRRGSPSRRR